MNEVECFRVSLFGSSIKDGVQQWNLSLFMIKVKVITVGCGVIKFLGGLKQFGGLGFKNAFRSWV